MTEHRFDAIVIGGGPAGCAAAISLARQRYRVILLEGERGAARKTCGEFLSATAVRWLEETNVLPRLLQRGAIPIPEWSLATPRRELVGELSPPGLALSRSILDPLLLEACGEEGAIVAEGSRVKSVVWNKKLHDA
jgi:menaquinone-9 beta-reductase